MNENVIRIFVCSVALVILPPASLRATDTGQSGEALLADLAEAGYENIQVFGSVPGMHGFAIVVSYQPVNRNARRHGKIRVAEADNVFRIALPHLTRPDLYIIALNVMQRSYRASAHYKGWDHIFRKARDDSWRRLTIDPQKYFETMISSETQESSPMDRAYWQWSGGMFAGVRNEPEQAITLFEAAVATLENAESDPDQVHIRSLFNLVGLYDATNDNNALDHRLQRIARALGEQRIENIDYFPVLEKAREYPRRALHSGIEGHVIVGFTVTRTGRVEQPFIIEGAPPNAGFGRAALYAAEHFRYLPRLTNGQFVSTPDVRNKITFRLE